MMTSIEAYSLEAANDTGVAVVDDIFQDIRALRSRIVTDWQERAVVLSREEQQALRDEIKSTCHLLTNLTATG